MKAQSILVSVLIFYLNFVLFINSVQAEPEVWFSGNNAIGRVTFDGALLPSIDIGTVVGGNIEVVGNEVWFANGYDGILRVTLGGTLLPSIDVGEMYVMDIAVVGNEVWFSGNNTIGRVTLDGVLLPSIDVGTVVGGNIELVGNEVWFGNGYDGILRVTPDGVLLPSIDVGEMYVMDIAVVGNEVWFSGNNAIGRVTLDGALLPSIDVGTAVGGNIEVVGNEVWFGNGYDGILRVTSDGVLLPSIDVGEMYVMDVCVLHSIHVLSVGVHWPDDPCTPKNELLSGDLDANNLATKLKAFLPSCIQEPNILCLDSLISDGSNLASFQSTLNTFLNQVRSGDTIIISFASHGDTEYVYDGPEPPFFPTYIPVDINDDNNYDVYVALDPSPTGDEYICLADENDPNDDSDRLYDDALENLLSDIRLATVKKILIFDNCRSGGFGPDLTESIPNMAVLAGCSEGYFTFSIGDGTGIFTNTIIKGLTQGTDGFPKADGANGGTKDGTVTLDELDAFIEAFDFGDLIGTNLPLRYLDGTLPFYGLVVDFTASDDFVGGFEGLFPGDLDNDKDVDMRDLTLFAKQWRETECENSSHCYGADLAPEGGDGTVNFLDLTIIIEHWLEGTTL